MIKKGDTIQFKGIPRGAIKGLGVVLKTDQIDYGSGRILQKAMILWINGPSFGKKSFEDVRRLEKIEV